MEYFTFDVRAAVTAQDQYQKDEHGGWIRGTGVLMSSEQKYSLQEAVRKRKGAFAYSMEGLPGLHRLSGTIFVGA